MSSWNQNTPMSPRWSLYLLTMLKDICGRTNWKQNSPGKKALVRMILVDGSVSFEIFVRLSAQKWSSIAMKWLCYAMSCKLHVDSSEFRNNFYLTHLSLALCFTASRKAVSFLLFSVSRLKISNVLLLSKTTLSAWFHQCLLCPLSYKVDNCQHIWKEHYICLKRQLILFFSSVPGLWPKNTLIPD